MAGLAGPRRSAADRAHRAVRRGRRGPDRAARTSCWSAACSTCPGARRGPAPPSCSSSSGSPRPPDRRGAAPTPAACGAASTSPPSLIASPSIYASTSRPPASTHDSRTDLWAGAARTSCADGTTLILTTQYLEEADRLADHGVVGARPGARHRERHPGQPEGRRSAGRPCTCGRCCRPTCSTRRSQWWPSSGRRRWRTRPARSSCPRSTPALLRLVADRLEAVDIPVAEIGLRLPSLDDVFLALTGHGAEEAA